jgi:glycosyltransferase involved in cell wall biosynthesis
MQNTGTDGLPKTLEPGRTVQKRVSIVINNYNYGRFIRQAIESALSQTYNNTEVIIVDDGSTDGSADIIQEYADRATVILKQNGGQASAFNVGVSRATGDLILLLDSDDYLLPEAVETCVEQFPEGYSRIFFRLCVVDVDGNRIEGSRVAVPFMDFDGSAIAAVAEGLGFPSIPTSGNVFDARQLKAILPIPEEEYRMCADAFVLIQTALRGPVRSVDRELGAYRVHGSNRYTEKSPRLLVDKKRLAMHVNNHFKTAKLIEQACLDSGLPHLKHRESSERRFYPLHILCAGYANGVESPYISTLTRKSLTRSIARYSKSGDALALKRLPQALYLLSIVWMPTQVSGLLMRLMDEWQRR